MDIHGYNDSYSSLKQKFDNYPVDLPADDWAVFSKKLAAAQGGRRRFTWYYIAAAASIIGILFIGFSYLAKTYDHPAQQALQAYKTKTDSIAAARAQQPIAIVSASRKVDAGNAAANTNQQTSRTISNVAQSPQAIPNVAKTTGQTATVYNKAKRETTVEISQANIDVPSATKNTATASAPSVNNFDTAGYITHPVPQYAELPELSSDKQNSESTNREKDKASGSNKVVNWLAGTFQGNLGLSSGSNGDILDDGSLGSHLLTRVAKADALQASSTPSIMSFSGNKTYYPPLSFGITVGIPLHGRWELQSGLVYTLLITTGNISSSSNTKGTGRIEENYLGIPVALSYAILQRPSFSMYILGGGKIDKGVSLVEKTFTYDSNDNLLNQTYYQYSISGFQFSLDAGIGASYRLYRFINWYLEVGGAWYIPGNQPESSRTEHPINVSIKTGIRFSLSK